MDNCSSKMKRLLPVLFFSVLTIIFLWEVFFKGWVPIPADILVGHYFPWKDYVWEGREAGFPIKNFHLFDAVFQLYPWRKFGIDLLKGGQIPLWNPYNLAGTPHLANLPTATFYPFNLLFLVFAFLPTWVFYISIQTVLAGTFMYLYLKNLKLTKIASLLGGVTFAFSSFMMMRYEYGIAGHTFLWVPLALLCVDRLRQKFSIKWWLTGVASVSFMFLGGSIQAMIYGYGLILAYIAYRLIQKKTIKEKRFRLLYFYGGFLILPFLLASIQLLPFIDIIPQSSRIEGYGDIGNEVLRYVLPWRRLVGIVAPDFYGSPSTGNFWGEISYKEFALYVGIIPLIFALYALIWTRKGDLKFWVVLLIVVFVLLLDTPIARIPYMLSLPGYSALLPSRLISLVDFAIPVLAAFGLSSFQIATRGSARKQFLKIGLVVFFLGVVLFLLWLLVFSTPYISPDADFIDKLAVSKRNLVLPTLYMVSAGFILIISYRIRLKGVNFALVLLLLLTSFDLVRQARKYNSFVPPSVVFPQTSSLAHLGGKGIPARVMITHQELFPANTNVPYGIGMIDGYDSIHPKRIEELLSVLNYQAVNAKRLNPGRVTFSANEGSTAIDLLSPEYVFTLDRELDSPRFDLVIQEGRTRLYKNLSSYPRVYLTKDIQIIKDRDRNLEAVLYFAQKGERKAVLEGGLSLSSEPIDSESRAEIIEYLPNKVTVKTSSNTDTLLVFNDAYDKGWRVAVDSFEGSVLRANYAFRGVALAQGEHKVEFIYDPQSYRIGKKLSISAFVFLLTIIFHGEFIKKRKRIARRRAS